MVVVKAALAVVVMGGRGGACEEAAREGGPEQEAGEGEKVAKAGSQEPRIKSGGLRDGVGEWEGAGPEMGRPRATLTKRSRISTESDPPFPQFFSNP